jgi:hypothetical protein
MDGRAIILAPGLVFLILVVIVVVAMSRWLQHREMMKMLELGGDAETVLRTRERWRNRAGLLYGAKLLVVGVVLVVMGQASSTWLAMVMPKREISTMGLTAPPLLIFLGLLLAAVGAVYLVAYAIWSRRPLFEDKPARSDPGANSGQEPPT